MSKLVNFPKIQIKFSENNIYKFTPTQYHTIDKGTGDLYPIVIYELMHIQQENTIKCYIPYYLSDGQTNGIRGDFIFPFMCFQNKDSIECPRKQNIDETRTRMIKYSLCKNLNLSQENLNILESLGSKYKGLANHYTNITDVGLGSFLYRLENLLDFILCVISSNKLKSYESGEMDEIDFIPYYSNKLSNDNLEKFKNNSDPSKSEYEHDYEYYKHWLNNIYIPEKDSKYIFNRQKMFELFSRNSNVLHSEYRVKIIKLLNIIRNNISTIFREQLTIENNYLDIYKFNIMTILDFNKIINVCVNSTINKNIADNFNIYKSISTDLYIDFIKKSNLGDLKKILVSNKCKSDSIEHIITKKWKSTCSSNIYNKLDSENKRKSDNSRNADYIKENDTIKKQKVGGHYNKYLKYKQKYLLLKNNQSNK